jgi:hypothetical protein
VTPDDPARALDDDVVRTPMAPDEREEVLSDLEDVEVLRGAARAARRRGVVAHCADCDDRALLPVGPAALEPAPPARRRDHAAARAGGDGARPDDYVSWDYARGFADASLES